MITPIPPEIRFWRSVDRSELSPGGCWIWTGTMRGDGYGQMTTGSRSRGHYTRKMLMAHRYSYELHNGPIPAGMIACHRCDNPKCVNPDHIFIGTHADNSADKVSKNRQARGAAIAQPGERNPSARMTEEQVRRVLALRGDGLAFSAIARATGLSKCHVHRICTGKNWKHVQVSGETSGALMLGVTF